MYKRQQQLPASQWNSKQYQHFTAIADYHQAPSWESANTNQEKQKLLDTCFDFIRTRAKSGDLHETSSFTNWQLTIQSYLEGVDPRKQPDQVTIHQTQESTKHV